MRQSNDKHTTNHDIKYPLSVVELQRYIGQLSDMQQKKRRTFVLLFSTPSGARTLDPNIKSVVLYQLS